MAIDINEVILSGTVMEDPQIVGEGDGAWAFIKLVTSFGERQPDGSYQDKEQVCQLVADVPHAVNTASKYIKAGKALAVKAYYKTWDAGGQINHGFFIRSYIFAKANWGAENKQYNNAPAMPN